MSQSPPLPVDAMSVDTQQQQQAPVAVPSQQQQQQISPVNDRKRPAETSHAELEKNVLEEKLKELARLQEFERKIAERGVKPEDLFDTFDKTQRAKEEAQLADARTMLEQFEQDVLPTVPENEREAIKLQFADYLKRGDHNAFQVMKIQTAANHHNRQMHLKVEAQLRQANKQLEEERAARAELEKARAMGQVFATTLYTTPPVKETKTMVSEWSKKFNACIDQWAGIAPSTSSTQVAQKTSQMELDNPFAIRQPAAMATPVQQQQQQPQQQVAPNSYTVGAPAVTQPVGQPITTTASGIDRYDGVAFIRNRFMKICADQFKPNEPMAEDFSADFVTRHFEEGKTLCFDTKDKYLSDYRDASTIKRAPDSWAPYKTSTGDVAGYFIPFEMKY